MIDNNVFIEGTGQTGAATVQQPLEVHNTNNGIAAFYTHSTGGNGPTLNFAKSDGTELSPSVIQTAENIAFIDFRGYDSTSYTNGAQLTVQSQGPWSTTAHGCSLAISSVPYGQSSLVEVFRFGAGTAGQDQRNISEVNLALISTAVLEWGNTFGANTAVNTGISKLSAGSLAIGNGILGDVSGKLSLAHLNVNALAVFSSNASAVTGGLVAGDLYRTGSDPDQVCIVH